MTVEGLLDKTVAIAKRDWLTAIRYRTGFLTTVLGAAAELAAFYYLARAIGAAFRPDGIDYFPFLLVGTGFYTFLVTGINAFLVIIQEAQQTGTLEVLMTTSTPAPVLLFLSALSAFAGSTLQLVFYIGAGLLLTDFPFHPKSRGQSGDLCAVPDHCGRLRNVRSISAIGHSKGIRASLAAGFRRMVHDRNAVPSLHAAEAIMAIGAMDPHHPRLNWDADGTVARGKFLGVGPGNRRLGDLLRGPAAFGPLGFLAHPQGGAPSRNAVFLLKGAPEKGRFRGAFPAT